MSGVLLGVAVAVTAAGVGISAAQGADQADQAKKSMEQSQANADRTAKQADQDFNRANQRKPDTAAILSAAQQAGKGGASGTMLTGAQGVDPASLTLGKNTLLGA